MKKGKTERQAVARGKFSKSESQCLADSSGSALYTTHCSALTERESRAHYVISYGKRRNRSDPDHSPRREVDVRSVMINLHMIGLIERAFRLTQPSLFAQACVMSHAKH